MSTAIERLRACSRPTKLVLVFLAAWAPLLPDVHPLIAGLVMAVGTGLFWVATSAPKDRADVSG